MAGFTVDYSKASSTYNVPDGEYEVTIIGAAWDRTGSGKEYIKVKLQVRNDVTQAEKGEIIEYPLWKSRPENAKASDISGIPAWRIHQISKAVGLADGEAVDTIDSWFRLIQGRPVLVATRQDDQGRAKVSKIEESRFPQVAPEGAVPVTDENLPF
jgi:hypothetical protein